MEESKTWEVGPNLSGSSTGSSRNLNFRDAVMGGKKPDRAMELHRAHALSKFFIPTLDLSQAEINSRQGRAESDNLTAQERDIKNGLLQGALRDPMSQWTSAHLALFTAVEFKDLGDTRYRDPPNKDCIDISELSSGELDSLFPDEAALLRHRSKVQATVQQAWCELMPDTPALKTADELFKKMQRTSVPISSTRKIPAIRIFLNAP